MAVIRLYGADIELFDQTWKPADVVKIKLERRINATSGNGDTSLHAFLCSLLWRYQSQADEKEQKSAILKG